VRGRLVRANEQANFEKVYDSDLVAMIPGGGWIAHYTGNGREPTATENRSPVVAWGLEANGLIDPHVRGDRRLGCRKPLHPRRREGGSTA
jgi:hypothetical protein